MKRKRPVRDVDEGPALDVPVELIACSMHLEPFRPRMPLGFVTFALELWPRVRDIPEFDKATGDFMSKAWKLLEQKPMCCRVEPDVLYQCYLAVDRKIGVWHRERCRICGNGQGLGCELLVRTAERVSRTVRGHGTAAAAAPLPAGQKVIKHGCLRCVSTGNGLFNVNRG